MLKELQTASFDTVVGANGVLAVRETPGKRRMGCGVDNGTCPAEPIKTAQNTETQGLSSLMAGSGDRCVLFLCF